MGVNVDGKIGVGLADGSNEAAHSADKRHCSVDGKIRTDLHSSSFGLQKTSHILDTQDVNALIDELLDEVEVILERVLGLLGASDVTTVANNGLDDTSCLLGSVNAEPHL